nr:MULTISPECIES: acyl-CoA reductase [unclassified Pseudoalteromonas]
MAFWCRRSNIKNLAIHYGEQLRLRQNKVFHITPANVDTVFLYTVLLSFLVGNTNIVRLSSRRGAISDELVGLIQRFVDTDKGALLGSRCLFIAYPASQSQVTATLSKWCDKRVVWGGDDAILQINQVAPVANELAFPDRFSISVLRLSSEQDAKLAAKQFFTDYQSFNQQACSSPKAIYWLCTKPVFKDCFWEALAELSVDNTQFELNHQLNRYINIQMLLMADLSLKATRSISHPSYLMLEFEQLNSLATLDVHEGNGLILSTNIESLAQLPEHEKLQTVGYFGISQGMVEDIHALRKIPLGSALQFNHIWDGVDLVKRLN